MPRSRHERCSFCDGDGLLRDCRLPARLVREINESYAVVSFDDGRVCIVKRDARGRCYRNATGMNLRFRHYGKHIQARWIADPRRHEIDLRDVPMELFGRGPFVLPDRKWFQQDSTQAREMVESLTVALHKLSIVGGEERPHIECAQAAHAIIDGLHGHETQAKQSREFIRRLYRVAETLAEQVKRQEGRAS
jgi:hypothetical protein